LAWLWPRDRKRRATIVAAVVLLGVVELLLLSVMLLPTPRNTVRDIGWRLQIPTDVLIPPEWKEVGGDRIPLDPVLEKVGQFSAQFNWPKTIPYDRSTEIIFIIEGDKPGSGDDLLKSFSGDPQKLEIRVTNQMSARLTAPKGDAEVTPRNEKQERQPVTHLGATKWIWDVKPERTGKVVLTLDVFAHVQLKSKNKTVPDAEVGVLTKRVEIPITVTLWDRTKTYLAEIDLVWKTIAAIGGGIAAVLTFLGLWQRKKAGTDLS
jgi:hypothetical protein